MNDKNSRIQISGLKAGFSIAAVRASLTAFKRVRIPRRRRHDRVDHRRLTRRGLTQHGLTQRAVARSGAAATQTMLVAMAMLVALGVSSPTALAGSKLPTPMKLSYNVYTEGTRVGEYAMEVTRKRAIYSLKSSLTPQGIAQLFAGGMFEQQSRFMVKRGKILPLTYKDRREGREPAERHLRFDWTLMEVTMPNGHKIPMPRTPLDAAVAPLQLMMTPPRTDRNLAVNVISERGVRTHTFSVVNSEQIETDLGALDTLHVQQRKKGAEPENYIDIWLAPSQGWIPVKIVRRKKSRDIEFNIASVTFADSPAPDATPSAPAKAAPKTTDATPAAEKATAPASTDESAKKPATVPATASGTEKDASDDSTDDNRDDSPDPPEDDSDTDTDS